MKFGDQPLARAEGAILAHSLTLATRKIRKGRRLDAADLRDLRAEGVASVVVARLDACDLHEDEAASRIARALVPDPQAASIRLSKAVTGRVNLYATDPGVVEMDEAAIRALNRVDSMITFACTRPYAQTRRDGLIGTVKIISYGVAAEAVERACAVGAAALHLCPTRLRSAALIVTELSVPHEAGQAPASAAPDGAAAGAQAASDDRALRAIAARVEALGMDLVGVRRVAHDASAIAGALRQVRPEQDPPGAETAADLILILTASATSDAHDVAPEGLRQAGGTLTRFGMPVDPGNLLFLGDLSGRPVIGLPGCARSPALNGADYVLARVAAGIAVSDDDIAGMAIGGLLKEIPQRGRLREG